MECSDHYNPGRAYDSIFLPHLFSHSICEEASVFCIKKQLTKLTNKTLQMILNTVGYSSMLGDIHIPLVWKIKQGN
jgi:hypothetical protein